MHILMWIIAIAIAVAIALDIENTEVLHHFPQTYRIH